MNVIETKGLTKTYGRRTVVQSLDWVMPEGACTVLVGANGAGKSTILKLLMNQVTPSSGTAMLLGKDCRSLGGPDFQNIGFASESQVLPPFLDTGGYFEYVRGLYSNWDSALEQNARRRLRIPGRRSLQKLSRGEKMKTCVAAALPFRPKILVMDEPLSGLDPLSREELVRLLTEYAQETSMLISTHDIAEVDRLGTHLVLMHEGTMVLQGDIETLVSGFQNVTLRVTGDVGENAFPDNWLNPLWGDGLLNFTHQVNPNGSGLMAELELQFGPNQQPAISSMSLAAISSAVTRAQSFRVKD